MRAAFPLTARKPGAIAFFTVFAQTVPVELRCNVEKSKV